MQNCMKKSDHRGFRVLMEHKDFKAKRAHQAAMVIAGSEDALGTKGFKDQ